MMHSQNNSGKGTYAILVSIRKRQRYHNVRTFQMFWEGKTICCLLHAAQLGPSDGKAEVAVHLNNYCTGLIAAGFHMPR